jgi:putative solute:sodium symporter small subunit
MTRDDTNGSTEELSASADGGSVATAAQRHEHTDYLDTTVNLLRPSTPFMRDHLRLVWASFVVWLLVVFGPVTLTAIAPGPMTGTRLFGFPLHYLTVSLGAPLGALVLSAIYAYRRDQLDEKYGIDHSTPLETTDDSGGDAAVADGGVDG